MRWNARKLLRSKNDELFLQGDNVTGCATVDARRQILQMCPGQRVGYCHHLFCHCHCHQQLFGSEGALLSSSLLSLSFSSTTVRVRGCVVVIVFAAVAIITNNLVVLIVKMLIMSIILTMIIRFVGSTSTGCSEVATRVQAIYINYT